MLKQLLLLADETPSQGGGWQSYILLGVLVVFFIGMMIFSSRSQKKRQQKVQDMINNLRVGDKVKTIGGIIGVIVEVCPDGAFVIETGSATKKSFMKFDKSAIYASADSSNQAATNEPKAEVYDETVSDDETAE